MSGLDPELVDASGTAAINIIEEIHREGQISDETANACREKFYRVHELLMRNLENEKKLVEESRILKQQLSQEVQKLEQANSSHRQHESTINELTTEINDVKNQIETVEDREAVSRNEIQTLENDKQDLQNDLKSREERERERLIPEIEMMQKKIKEQQTNKEINMKAIDNKEKQNKDLEDRIELLKKKANEKGENETLASEYLNIKNDPDRWSKKNKSFENEVGVLKKQVDSIRDAIKKIENKKKKHEDAAKLVDDEIEELDAKLKEKEKDMTKLKDQLTEKSKEINENQREKKQIEQERDDLSIKIKMLKEDKRSENEKKNKLKKEIDEKKSEYKRSELQLNNYDNLIKEHSNTIGSVTKMKEERLKEEKQQNEYSKKIHEENQLFFGVLVNKAMEKNSMDNNKEQIRNNIVKSEQSVEELREEENKLIEEIKFLSTIREKMARTASQAMAQARETKEELKVKELLILDLNKKFQETEFRLNSFVALYEEVKNARNKYVSMIQNSSQDLAEMKERIKILQNEVEILRNECSEKDRALVDIKHSVTIEVYNRDAKRAELNKCDFRYRN